MKVKTLIEELCKFNPDAEVKLNDYNGGPALFVNARSKDNSIVWIDGEHDLDMREEIRAQYEHADLESISRIDLYKTFIKIGITIDMVRKYMNNDLANEMEQICKENNLL